MAQVTFAHPTSSTPLYGIGNTSTIVVTKDINITAQETNARFINGDRYFSRPVSGSCWILLKSARQNDSVIKAGTRFSITKITNRSSDNGFRDDNFTTRIYVHSLTISDFGCYRSGNTPTVGYFQQEFGDNVTIENGEADVLQ